MAHTRSGRIRVLVVITLLAMAGVFWPLVADFQLAKQLRRMPTDYNSLIERLVADQAFARAAQSAIHAINPHGPAPTNSTRQSAQTTKYQLVVLRGKVIEIGPYLMQKHQVPMDDDLGKNVIALLTNTGEVHPIIKDLRSRGYWLDKRLRDRPMELHVHRFPGVPFVRLIDAFSIKDGKKYRVDYWCSVCAITTFEPGPCPCCQDDIPLREVLVE